MKRFVATFFVLVFLLTACNPDPAGTDPVADDPVDTTAPDHTTGENVPGTAPAVDFDGESRCSITSNGKMAETEAGYYMLRSDYLFYADKTDLTNWVLVCNRPECEHKRSSCNAALGYCFWRENGNNYCVASTFGGKTLDTESVIGVASDGTESWIAYSDGSLPASGKSSSFLVSQDGYYVCTGLMLEDGTWDCMVSRLKDEKFETLFLENYPATTNVSCFATATNIGIAARGDIILTSQIPLDGTSDEEKEGWDTRPYLLFYQITNDTIREIPLIKEDLYGAFLYKDHLCFYRQNDGFYHMDLATGVETKFANAGYENACGHCVDGRYIIESTLGIPYYPSTATEAQMRYFDGETWHELELPEEWNTGYALRVLAGTTEGIFFTVDDDNESYSQRQQMLCYLPFGADSFTVVDTYPCSLRFE